MAGRMEWEGGLVAFDVFYQSTNRDNCTRNCGISFMERKKPEIK